MAPVLQFVSIAAILIGTFFSVVGVLGFIRLPDVYTRLHATGKVGVFGVVLLLVASVFWAPFAWGRGVMLILLLIIIGPVTAHALSSAANRIGLPRKNAVRDDLLDHRHL